MLRTFLPSIFRPRIARQLAAHIAGAPRHAVFCGRNAVQIYNCSSRAGSHVLGIETSCDDTGIAIVDEKGEILAEALSSQWDVHEEYGGVYPLLAARAHEENFQHVFDEVKKQYEKKFSLDDNDHAIKAVAVTAGPGLAMCLHVGMKHATKIANTLNVPLLPINHLEAHILMARMENFRGNQPEISGTTCRSEISHGNLEYPFLVLLVSGGHCMLVIAKGIGQFESLGATLDDSIGEAFDKVARFLEISFNSSGGGPAIEKLASRGDENSIKFPIPLIKHKNCNFSFSGLKTSVKYASEKLLNESSGNELKRNRVKADIAASFQKAAVTHLEHRLRRAITLCKEKYNGTGNSAGSKDLLSEVVVCGGVAANKYLRKRLDALGAEFNMNITYPTAQYCTDNGVMVAWAGMERLLQNDYTIPSVPQNSLDRFDALKEASKSKSEKDELFQFYPSWPL